MHYNASTFFLTEMDTISLRKLYLRIIKSCRMTAPTDKKRPAAPQDVRGLFPIGNFWKSKWGLLLLLALVVGTFFILRKASNETWHESGGKIFGTRYSVKYLHAEPLDDAILAVLDSVDASMSLFSPQSTLSRINANATDTADALLLPVLQLAQQVSAATDGAFDVTVAPLVNLWGFGNQPRQDVTDAEVDSLRPFVGWQHIRLEGCRVVKSDPRVMLDCGAVAKGYAVDCVARLLERRGIRNYLVEIGGEVRVAGHNDRSEAWTIGVQKPLDDPDGESNSLQATLPLTQGAVATSGNYRNFYEKGGRKYAHTIHPKTGRPVRHSLLSATVLAPDCATADAYATAFMVMGIEKGKDVLAKHPELKACFIYEEGGAFRTWHSPGLRIQE